MRNKKLHLFCHRLGRGKWVLKSNVTDMEARDKHRLPWQIEKEPSHTKLRGHRDTCYPLVGRKSTDGIQGKGWSATSHACQLASHLLVHSHRVRTTIFLWTWKPNQWDSIILVTMKYMWQLMIKTTKMIPSWKVLLHAIFPRRQLVPKLISESF